MSTPALIPNMPIIPAVPLIVTPVAVKQPTFLQHAGGWLRTFLHIGVIVLHDAEQAAVIAAPIVGAFTGVGPLFNSAIGLAYAVEGTAATATGTGPQKLAQVIVGLNPLIDKFVADNNLGSWETANRAKFASAIADALNLIPAPKG